MKKKLQSFFGWIDYSTATLEDIISGLHDEYLSLTEETITKLEELKKKAVSKFDHLDASNKITDHIEYFLILFRGFEYDFNRVIKELPRVVEERHINIIDKIYKRSCYEEKFQQKEYERVFIEKNSKDKSSFSLVCEVYNSVLNPLVLNKNLNDMKIRLQTFVETESIPKEKAGTLDGKKTKEQAFIPFPAPPGATWQDVSIRFLSNVAVELKVGDKREGRQFSEIGFMDNRSKKYNFLWFVLIVFGKFRGEISWETPGLPIKLSKNLKKHIHRLGKHLCQLFQIKNENPFKYHKKTGSYEAKFNVDILNIDAYDDVYDDFSR